MSDGFPTTNPAAAEDARSATNVAQQPHYTARAIQPVDFIVANGMDYLEGNVVKYVARYRRKNGLEDLKKARTYLDLLIAREERGEGWKPTDTLMAEGRP